MEIKICDHSPATLRSSIGLLAVCLILASLTGAAEATMSKKRGLMGARSGTQKVSKGEDRPERKKLFSFGKRLQEKVKTPSESVRTTAYTHTESDHIRYGRKNAIGTTLMYGSTRSAAADWSVFPLGTKFRIEGDPSLYVIDDYGSALVGSRTIDLYKPSRGSMNAWGVRHVEIKVIEWGCPKKSLKMLEGRSAYRHVREMIKGLERKV